MVVIKKTFKKIAYAVLCALGVGTLTSCYGMPNGMPYGSPYTVYGTVTSDGTTGIEGIEVTITYGSKTQTSKTGKNGSYYFSYIFDSDDLISGIDCTLNFKDVDGETNGSFPNQEAFITFHEDDYEIEKNVILDSSSLKK